MQSIQRASATPSTTEQPTTRLSKNAENAAIATAPHEVQNEVRSPGHPLDSATKHAMGSRFGHDFSQVRLHTGDRAAQSARSIDAKAYTIGRDVVLGNSAPLQSRLGKHMLAHELAHVVQQEHGNNVKPTLEASNPQLETDAQQAATAITHGTTAQVTYSSAVGLAREPRSLQMSLHLPQLSQTELEEEAAEIEKHLNANPVSNEENDRLLQILDQIRAELGRRSRQEQSSKPKKGRKQNASRRPRSLRESFAIDETLSDAELYDEIDAIHDALRAGVSKGDRRILNDALHQLETERQRRKGVAAAQERAAKIQQAFTPTVTSNDGDALIQVMGVVDSLRPSSSASGMYALMWNGEVIMLTQSEVDQIRSSAHSTLSSNLAKIQNRARDALSGYNAQKDVDKEFPVVSTVVQFVGGIDDPGPAIRQNVVFVNANAETARAFLERGNFSRAAEFFANSDKFATIAHRQYRNFVDGIQTAGSDIISVLEITRDVSFAVALTIGAIVAAPVVAAGVSGAGLTGATGVVATGLGTGGVVAVEGAALRGTSATAGTALAGGSFNESIAAGYQEGKRGAKEGFAIGVTGGVGQGVGTSLRVGTQGLSRGSQIARGAVTSGTASAAGEGTAAALEGKDAGDVLKASSRGFGVGLLGGAGGTVASTLKNPTVQKTATFGVGALASGTGTYLAGGSEEDIFRSAAIGGTASSVIASATRPTGPTEAQKLAFEKGRSIRRTAQAGLAATMIGTSNAVPATHISGGGTGVAGRPLIGIVSPAEASVPVTPATSQTATTAPTPAAPAIASPVSAAVSPTRQVLPSSTTPGVATTTAATAVSQASRPQIPPDIDQAVEQAFQENLSTPAVRGVSKPRVGEGDIDKAVPTRQQSRIDIEDIPRQPGETMRQALARVRTVIGQQISAIAPLNAAWQRARTHVLQNQTLTASNYEALYNQTRNRFWQEVRSDPAAMQYLANAGFVMPSGPTTAPMLGGVTAAVPATERRISLDHIAEKAIGNNWQRALDADNLRMEFAMPNTYREIIQSRHPELR